jgi:hypothetical protein
MNKLIDKFCPGDYVTIENCRNLKTVYILISCNPVDIWSSNEVVSLVYTAECELISNKHDQYGERIWEEKRCWFIKKPYSCCNFRTDRIQPSTDAEIATITNALAKQGVIWNRETLSFDERPLPDISRGLVLNEDTRYAWQKLLLPYAGKVHFEKSDDLHNPGENVYGCRWAGIWEILLREKLDREDKTKKQSFDMNEHMFDTLRFLYQAPLIGISWEHENKRTNSAFIVIEKNNRYDENYGFVMGEHNIHVVSNMCYGVHAVMRIDLYKKDHLIMGSHQVKLYLPNQKH